MNAYVLLNLLNELKKKDKMQSSTKILIAFRQQVLKIEEYRSMIVKLFLSYHTKLLFWHEIVSLTPWIFPNRFYNKDGIVHYIF